VIPAGAGRTVLPRVDHLVYAVPHLDSAAAALETRLGIRPTPGGRHEGRGTRNALIALGDRTYLEIIGPDPEALAPDRPRWFGVDRLTAPRLAGWAASGQELGTIVEEAARRGVRLGAVETGSRRRPDGVVLSWLLTDPTPALGDGIVPFFIDWGESPHPADAAARGATLVGLRAEHPEPEKVSEMLAAVGVALDVRAAAAPALVAELETPRGRVELR
jgi:glyoxalase-like protein